MNMKKYNNSLFFGGLLLNILAKAPVLLIAVVLMIVGIWKRPCLIIGICIAAAVLLWCLIEQIILKTAVENNKDENFAPFADALTSDNWKEKLEKVTDDLRHDETHNENEEDR